MHRATSSAAVALILGAACAAPSPRPPPPSGPPFVPPAAAGTLRAPADFDAIADRTERSRMLFLEASRVLTHARCVNCHPADDTPRQGDASLRHDPPVHRGDADRGVPAMECASCHQDRNLDHARVPGAPDWHLAPRTMAWLGRTPSAICEQLKDPARTRGKDLAAVAEHVAHDHLVAWAFAPGAGRTVPPGDQAALAALIQGWIATGAACPTAPATDGGAR